MSRIGIKPVVLPSGVTVEITNSSIKVKGSKGELSRTLHPSVKVEQKENALIVSVKSKEDSAIHGLFRSLIYNMVEGVSKGYEKNLEIQGVGYRFKISGNKLTLNLGFSHPVDFIAKEGIKFEEDKENKGLIIIKGIDKELVGETAAKIRSLKPPEPYKGKGIRYLGEHIQKKAGKAAASAAGGGAK